MYYCIWGYFVYDKLPRLRSQTFVVCYSYPLLKLPLQVTYQVMETSGRHEVILTIKGRKRL